MEKPKAKYKVIVAFEFCGVLVNNCKYSWRYIYSQLNVEKGFSLNNYSDFTNKLITYKEWVKRDLERYQKEGLNLFEIKKKIKNDLSLISGGLDLIVHTLLEDIDMPYKLFDKMFINRMEFDWDGKLKNIIPTEYDWDEEKYGVKGKYQALEELFKEYEIVDNNYILVCNNENTFGALNKSNIGIICSYDNYMDSDEKIKMELGSIKGTLVILNNPEMKNIVNLVENNIIPNNK